MELPKINVKEIQRVMDWLDFKEGKEGEPIHAQGTWVTQVDRLDPTAYETKRWYHYLDHKDIELEENWCGTACCVAGYVALPYIDIDSAPDTVEFTFGVTKPYTTPDGEVIHPTEDGGMCYDVEVAAQTILGLTAGEACRLFAGGNDKDDIRALFNEFLEARGEAVRV